LSYVTAPQPLVPYLNILQENRKLVCHSVPPLHQPRGDEIATPETRRYFERLSAKIGRDRGDVLFGVKFDYESPAKVCVFLRLSFTHCGQL